MPLFNSVMRKLAFVTVLCALTGCSEYLDRRDTVSLQGGNAVLTDRVTQMVDPWPRASADRDIAFDGAVMESAVARYRTGHVIPPGGNASGSSYGTPNNNTAPLGPQVNQSAGTK